MGSRRTHEEAAVAAARAAYVAGFAATLQPRGPAAVRRTDRRHERARLHPAARHRARRVPGPGRRARGRARPCWSTPTTSARRSGSAVEIAGGRARRGPARLRRPRRARHAGARAAGLPRRDAHPDRGDQRPRRVRDRRAGRARRSTGTASAPSWSPAAATRPAASSTSWSPREDERPGAPLVSVAKKSTDKISHRRPQVRAAPASAAGVAEAEVIGDRRAAGDDGDDRALLVPLVRGGEIVGREPLDEARAAARARRGPSCRSAAQQMSRGEPVIPTVYLEPRDCLATTRAHDSTRADRRRRPERLLRGRLAGRRGRRRGRRRDRRRCSSGEHGMRRSWPPGTTTSTRAGTSRPSPTSSTPGRRTAWSAPTG